MGPQEIVLIHNQIILDISEVYEENGKENLYVTLCQVLLFNYRDSIHNGKRGMLKKIARPRARTWTVRDLNDAFKAVVKPECQDFPISMVQARPECLNNLDQKTGSKDLTEDEDMTFNSQKRSSQPVN